MNPEGVDKVTQLTPDRRGGDRRRPTERRLDLSKLERKDVDAALNVWSFLLLLCMVVPWVMGVVLAKVGWLTYLAVIMPPYAWYLTAEKFMQLHGLL